MAEICFAYRPDTGEFAGRLEADPSPLEPGVWLYPAHTTAESPPPATTGTVAVHRDGSWILLPDYRGETWFHGSSPAVITALGDPADFDPPLTREAADQPAKPEPTPARVEDWQFAGQAAEEGIITRAEALDWSGAGIVPPTLVKAVDRLITDEDQHFKVMIFLRGSKSYPRGHSLVPLLGRVFGKADDAALDAFWIAAGRR